MGKVKKSITFTEQEDAYIKNLIEQGIYTNDSEFFKDLINRDKEYRNDKHELDNALIEGLESGLTDETVESICNTAIKQYGEKS